VSYDACVDDVPQTIVAALEDVAPQAVINGPVAAGDVSGEENVCMVVIARRLAHLDVVGLQRAEAEPSKFAAGSRIDRI